MTVRNIVCQPRHHFAHLYACNELDKYCLATARRCSGDGKAQDCKMRDRKHDRTRTAIVAGGVRQLFCLSCCVSSPRSISPCSCLSLYCLIMWRLAMSARRPV